jgi:hypothetical protein
MTPRLPKRQRARAAVAARSTPPPDWLDGLAPRQLPGMARLVQLTPELIEHYR